MKKSHFLVVIIATVLTFTFVWVRLKIVSISYDIHDLQEKEKKLREESNSISLNIHQARSPYRLDAISRDKFHMGPPRTDQIIVMKQSK